MATKYIKLRGYVIFPMLYKPDEYMDSRFWKVSFQPENDAELVKLHKSGIKLKARKDDKGHFERDKEYYIFKRPCMKMIKGEEVDFMPPWVKDRDGKFLVSYDEDGNRVGEPVLVGNGSLVEMEVVVYDAGKFKGSRFNGLRLIDHIEYVPPEEVEQEEENDEPPFEVKSEEKVEEKKPEPEKKEKKRVKW